MIFSLSPLPYALTQGNALIWRWFELLTERNMTDAGMQLIHSLLPAPRSGGHRRCCPTRALEGIPGGTGGAATARRSHRRGRPSSRRRDGCSSLARARGRAKGPGVRRRLRSLLMSGHPRRPRPVFVVSARHSIRSQPLAAHRPRDWWMAVVESFYQKFRDLMGPTADQSPGITKRLTACVLSIAP